MLVVQTKVFEVRLDSFTCVLLTYLPICLLIGLNTPQVAFSTPISNGLKESWERTYLLNESHNRLEGRTNVHRENQSTTQEWSLYGCTAYVGYQSLISRLYRLISDKTPHYDQLYPSCSRFIAEATQRRGFIGLIVGFGRFSSTHLIGKYKRLHRLHHTSYPRWIDPIDRYPSLITLRGNRYTVQGTSSDRNCSLNTFQSEKNCFLSLTYWSTHVGDERPCSEDIRMRRQRTNLDWPDPHWRLD